MSGVKTRNLNVKRPALQDAAKKAGQVCTEPPDLRWDFAQRRIREFLEQRFTCENLLSAVAPEMGCSRADIRKWHCLKPTYAVAAFCTDFVPVMPVQYPREGDILNSYLRYLTGMVGKRGMANFLRTAEFIFPILTAMPSTTLAGTLIVPLFGIEAR